MSGGDWIIEAAIPAETETIAALQQRCFSDADAGADDCGWDAEAIECFLTTAGVFAFIARQGTVAVGFILCRVAAEEGEVLTCGVDPQCRRSGLGRGLLTAALDEAARRGARQIFLEVGEDNLAGRGLYATLGFRPIGRRRAYYRQGKGKRKGADALIMQADL
jgi:[ribosomal protein S18]-alanine N-acetyltransferase